MIEEAKYTKLSMEVDSGEEDPWRIDLGVEHECEDNSPIELTLDDGKQATVLLLNEDELDELAEMIGRARELLPKASGQL